MYDPIVTLQTFEIEKQALQLANSSHYELSAIIWTQGISQANRLATYLQADTTWVNCWTQPEMRTPHGGVKNSGTGKEGGWESIQFFTEPKNVCVVF